MAVTTTLDVTGSDDGHQNTNVTIDNSHNGQNVDYQKSGRDKPSYRRVRVTIVGAGVSGIQMAYKIQKHLNDYVVVQILEKSPQLGGTWYENRYPGCACDVPSHCYQYSFAPNPDWSKFYASSGEIRNYLNVVAKQFGIDKLIRFNIKVVNAQWSEAASTWTLYAEDGSLFESEVFINAGGILNNPQMPNVEGLDTFAGPTLHTADWDSTVSLEGKRVCVIGAGASAVQLLPQIQPLVTNTNIFIRTPSWISPPIALPNANSPNPSYGDAEKEAFRENGSQYLQERKRLETHFNNMFDAFFKASPQQRDLRQRFEARMKTLIHDEDLQKRLIPDFEAGCRRINPGEQYLSTLQESNVSPVFDEIERVTPRGVVAGGVEYECDVLVAATGFNTTFRPRFPIVGRKGINLQELWSQNPTSYLGTGVSGFPNYLIFLGPNTPISNGSLMGPIEATGDYFIRILSKMVRQRVRSFDVRLGAQDDFNAHTQAFMRHMVWTGTCRSWFKKGTDGKVSALWPGSSLQYMQVLAEDRWEDYEWRYDGERFAYWRDGFSWIERPELDPLGIAAQEYRTTMTTIPDKASDLSFYLKTAAPIPQAVPLKPATEQPEQQGEDTDSTDESRSESITTCVDEAEVLGVQTVLPKELTDGAFGQHQTPVTEFVVPV